MTLEQAGRKITYTLLAAQSLGSAGTITTATVASIVGAELSGQVELAGIPSSVTQLGGAFSALLVSFLSEKLGRRLGLGFGVGMGSLGALIAAFAVFKGSFILLLAGLLVSSSAQAAFKLGRFAAAEVNAPARRGQAVALVVLGSTVGSVIGPLLVAQSSEGARGLGINALVGPYGIVFLLYALAALVLFFFLYPEPRELAQQVTEAYPQPGVSATSARPLGLLLQQPGVIMAVVAMLIGYAVMVMMMGITSLHMKQHAHTLQAISLVFSAHTLGMFAFSTLTGWLVDHWGRLPIILLGSLMLIGSCLGAPLSTAFWPLVAGLFFLGLGWNFCYVGGSTLLIDQLSPLEKTRTQGINDWLIGLASAAAGGSSGLLLARIGYNGLGYFGAALSLIMLVVALWYSQTGRPSGGATVPV